MKSLLTLVVLLLLVTGCTLNSRISTIDFDNSESINPSSPSEKNPTLVISSPLDGINNSNKSNYPIQGTCNSSAYEVYLESNNLSAPTNKIAEISCTDSKFSVSLDLNSISDGQYYLRVKSKESGKVTTEHILVKDSVAPTVQFVSTPSTINSLSQFLATVNLNDVVKVSYKWGPSGSTLCSNQAGYSGFADADQGITFDVSAAIDGTYRLCVVGRDNAGNSQNISSATVFNWTKDTSVPTAVAATIPTAATNLSSLNLTVSSAAAYKYKFGKANTTDCSTTTSYSSETLISSAIVLNHSSGVGIYRLCLIGKSSAGVWQTEALATAYNWMFDNVVPNVSSVTFSSLSTNDSTSQTPALNWTAATDTDSGIDVYEIAVGTASGLTDIANFSSVGSVLTIQLSGLTLVRGNTYHASLRAKDIAGNLSSVVSTVSWSVPTVSPLTIGPLGVTLDVLQPWKFTASGGAPPYTYSLSQSYGTIDSSTGVYTSDEVGGHVLDIRVTDNDGTMATTQVTITAAPEINCGSTTSTYARAGKFYDNGGSSGDYTNSYSCYIYIYHYADNVKFKFNSFSVEALDASYDLLRIYDANYTVVGSLQGTTIPADVTATGTFSYIYFNSNASVTSSGWEMSWAAQPNLTPSLLLAGQAANRTRHFGFVDTTVTLAVRNGIGPFSFSIVSGGGSITNVTSSTATFTPLTTEGVTTLRVTDALGTISERTYTVNKNTFSITSTISAWINRTAGSTFTVSGTGLIPTLTVSVGGLPCATLTHTGSTYFSCAPSLTLSEGCHDVIVTNGDGIGTHTLPGYACFNYGTWTSMPTPSTQTRMYYGSAWTGDRWVIWGGQDANCTQANCTLSDGYVYNPLTDSWSTMAAGPLTAVVDITVFWTGHEVLFHGGRAGGGVSNQTATYNPYTNTWTNLNQPGGWQSRQCLAAAWTGNELIIEGGQYGGVRNETAAFNVRKNTWRFLNSGPTRWLHRGVWTGDRMIVGGGGSTTSPTYTYSNTFSSFDLESNTWTSIATPNLRDMYGGWTQTSNMTTFLQWIGDRLLVAGYSTSYSIAATDWAATYNPDNDTWTNLPNFPNAGSDAPSAWTGSHFIQSTYSTTYGYNFITNQKVSISSNTANQRLGIVWTGKEILGCYGSGASANGGACQRLNLGGLHNRLSSMNNDSWLAMSSTDAPAARDSHTSIWSGKYQITWGGHTANSYLNSGAFYEPYTDLWTTISSVDAPSARTHHTALWGPRRMLIWGGKTGTPISPTYTNTGGIFNPNSNSWTTIDTSDADTPTARELHSAVWTGSTMLVWGGYDGSQYLANGGIYKFSSNDWTPISTVNAPLARAGHKALWNGEKMIVWGGSDGVTNGLAGGLYDPVNHLWTPMNLSGAPSDRLDFAMIIADNKVVVWGGRTFSNTPLSDGAIYDIATDSWTPISGTNAPSARFGMGYVFTDRYLILSGGTDSLGKLSDTFQFNPLNNSWQSLSSSGLEASSDGSLIWTGTTGDGRGQGSLSYRSTHSGNTGRIIYWGGNNGTNSLGTGKIYNLLLQ